MISHSADVRILTVSKVKLQCFPSMYLATSIDHNML